MLWREPFALVLLSIGCYAVYYLSLRLFALHINQALGVAILQLSALAASALIFVSGSVGAEAIRFSWRGALLACLAGVGVGLAELLLATAYSRGMSVSTATPLAVSGAILVTSLLGWLFLAERFSPLQWLGLVLICIGLWLVAAYRPDAAS